MDKYEEFKKWFENQDEIIWHSVKYNTGFIGSEPFNEFEKELKEKQKEEKIKKIIADAIRTTPLNEISEPKPHTIYCGDELIDKIYNKLKKGEYLK